MPWAVPPTRPSTSPLAKSSSDTGVLVRMIPSKRPRGANRYHDAQAPSLTCRKPPVINSDDYAITAYEMLAPLLFQVKLSRVDS